MNEVLQRIEKIKSIFLDTQLFYAQHDNIETVLHHLENADPVFRSIAYERTSMAIAIKDLENNQQLDNWLLYANGPALAHKAQVYVGHGWAIAKLGLPFLPVVQKLEQGLYYRVADGCGFYDRTFRQRQSVINQQLPVYLPVTAITSYDEGIGRSLWYTNNADIDIVRSKINSFPPSRQSDLWRGIGIAVAYVGGCDESIVKTLFEYASVNANQLARGAALAVRSRMQANALLADTDQCSRLWFALITGTVSIENEKVYLAWIKKIEEDLSNSFELE